MKSSCRSLLAAATGALLAGCAQAPITPTAAAAAAEPPVDAVVTGSRLPQRIDPVTGKVVPNSSVRVYSRADLDRTGRVGLAESLPWALATQP